MTSVEITLLPLFLLTTTHELRNTGANQYHNRLIFTIYRVARRTGFPNSCRFLGPPSSQYLAGEDDGNSKGHDAYYPVAGRSMHRALGMTNVRLFDSCRLYLSGRFVRQ